MTKEEIFEKINIDYNGYTTDNNKTAEALAKILAELYEKIEKESKINKKLVKEYKEEIPEVTFTKEDIEELKNSLAEYGITKDDNEELIKQYAKQMYFTEYYRPEEVEDDLREFIKKLK